MVPVDCQMYKLAPTEGRVGQHVPAGVAAPHTKLPNSMRTLLSFQLPSWSMKPHREPEDQKLIASRQQRRPRILGIVVVLTSNFQELDALFVPSRSAFNWAASVPRPQTAQVEKLKRRLQVAGTA